MSELSDISSPISKIKHTIIVLSGKGGVGKSTVASQMALCLVDEGFKVGLLDVDLCGPNIPRILGLEGKSAFSSSKGWIPVYADQNQNLAVMSLGFLLEDRDNAVIWRGPKKSATIRQFLEQVVWGNLDYLIIDTPPGTSDEHISVCENISKYTVDGAIIITTPQNVSIGDVRREITFCKKINIPILGIIENMSSFTCPCCGEITNIFSSGGGETLAKQMNIKYLGKIPLDQNLASACDTGKNFIKTYPNSESLLALKNFVQTLVSQLKNGNL